MQVRLRLRQPRSRRHCQTTRQRHPRPVRALWLTLALFVFGVPVVAQPLFPERMRQVVDDAGRMSIAVYGKDPQLMDDLRRNGWELLGLHQLPSGLNYGVWERRSRDGKTELFVAFAGTAGAKDGVADVAQAIAGPIATRQYTDALTIADTLIRRADNDSTLTVRFTGHSLGGGMAQMVGLEFGVLAVTFNAAPIQESSRIARLLTFLHQKNRPAQRELARNNVYNLRLRGDLVSSAVSPGRQHGQQFEYAPVKPPTGQWTGSYTRHAVQTLLDAFRASRPPSTPAPSAPETVPKPDERTRGVPNTGRGQDRAGVFAGVAVNEADFEGRPRSSSAPPK